MMDISNYFTIKGTFLIINPEMTLKNDKGEGDEVIIDLKGVKAIRIEEYNDSLFECKFLLGERELVVVLEGDREKRSYIRDCLFNLLVKMREQK